MKAILLEVIALFGCIACSSAQTDATPTMGFGLGIIARDSGPNVERHVVSGTSETVLVTTPLALSSFDLEQVRSVTRGSWLILSGRHRTTTLVLTLKPEAVARFQNEVNLAVSRADRFAILLSGEVIGVMIGQYELEGNEFAIDASFFSSGTEREKEHASKTLARQINSTLR